jgi:quinol monooxygenase YgiN
MPIEQITIVCFIKAKQETKKTVKDFLIHMMKMTRKEAGNLNYDLHVSDADDSLFIIYENWPNQGALDNHMAQPYLKEFIAKQGEWLEKPVDGKICRIIK